MIESKKLTAVRDQLVRQRRAIVDGFQPFVEPLDGDEIRRVQAAIDAVDRAIADEILAEYRAARRIEACQSIVRS
jgi:hypothetical protein